MQFSSLLAVSLLMLSITTKADALHLYPITPTASTIISAEEKADLLLQAFLKKTRVAGVSVSVNRAGNLIYSKGVGYANIVEEIPMEPSSQIRTASVAKVITATALGKLATDGKLDFDLAIGNYIPNLAEPYASLTTRQIAGHTAGIPHRPSSKQAMRKHYNAVQETIVFFEDTPLLFEPNTAYEYSTLGYNLLAILIEEVSGKRYEDYLQKDVFAPLNMLQTFPENIKELHAQNASSYYIKNGQPRLDKRLVDGSYKLAGAGFRSTSADLANMMNAYFNGFLAEDVVSNMFTTNTLANGELTNVGIGWRLSEDFQGRPTVEHAGAWQGARTVIVHYPDEQLTVSIMINTKCSIFIEETAQIIAQLFLEAQNTPAVIGEVNTPLKVVENHFNDQDEYFTGKLIMTDEGIGELNIEAERNWLGRNQIFYLSSSNNFVLSTTFGLLYLRLEFTPTIEGKVFLYQSLNDPHHPRGEPMLYFEQAN
ncbi:MAG: serine hydrolase domain-containing protein [Bacteroidota bacterium]